ncbi:MAG: hypothetical protein OEX04_20500, partial [Acidimicrobiia bacterium]|nr:hypothetical protein [Acidimicrobiia bacterium]
MRARIGILSIISLVTTMVPLGAMPALADHIPPVTVTDSQGPDQLDQANDPGGSQQDLTAAIIAPHGAFGWAWDETNLSGNNSIDTCTYFEEADGTVTSVCYSVQFDDASTITAGFPVYAVYDCGLDYSGSQQKCNGNNPVSTQYAVSCETPVIVDSYFTPDDQPDLQAECQLTGLNGNSVEGLRLLNTCTKTSASPSSNSNDCIFEELPAFLQLVKEVADADASLWTMTASAGGVVVLSADGISPLSPVEEGTYTLAESGPSTHALESLLCSTDGGPAVDITDSGQIALTGGTATVCTFTNTPSITAPDISVVKTANPTSLPEPGGTVAFTVVVNDDRDPAVGDMTITEL